MCNRVHVLGVAERDGKPAAEERPEPSRAAHPAGEGRASDRMAATGRALTMPSAEFNPLACKVVNAGQSCITNKTTRPSFKCCTRAVFDPTKSVALSSALSASMIAVFLNSAKEKRPLFGRAAVRWRRPGAMPAALASVRAGLETLGLPWLPNPREQNTRRPRGRRVDWGPADRSQCYSRSTSTKRMASKAIFLRCWTAGV
jgi:hypothetical protein